MKSRKNLDLKRETLGRLAGGIPAPNGLAPDNAYWVFQRALRAVPVNPQPPQTAQGCQPSTGFTWFTCGGASLPMCP